MENPVSYRQLKEETLSKYDSFVQIIDEISQGREAQFEKRMKNLNSRAENIRNSKFMLMVVGEAKSGKSTFINAYLKKDILPMDVKQCTNAIVEIRDGEKYRLIATYPDGRTKIIDDENLIKDFMKDNAAMDDDYRDIPVSLINSELLMKWKDNPASEDDIRALLKNVTEDNIHHLSPQEYEKKIRDYIQKRKNSWRDLVNTIVIEYPFEDQDLKGIEILDTPGVGAAGKVGDITNQFIEKANAVMFLKSISGSALESSSFKTFLGSNSSGRNKNAMFLVLTYSADKNEKDRNTILQEALKQYSDDISEHQIIAVDSKAEMFANSVSGMDVPDIYKLIRKLIENKEADNFVLASYALALPFVDKFKDKFIEELGKQSNFNEMRNRLNLFAHQAQYIELSGFLESMLHVTQKASAIISDSVKNWGQKAEDPNKLKEDLEKTKEEIEKLTAKITGTVNNLQLDYIRRDGLIEKKAEEVISEFKGEIAEIEKNGGSLDKLRDISLEKIERIKKVELELQNTFVKECDEQLIKCSHDKIDFSILQPDLTPEEIDDIIKTIKGESTDTIPVDDGCFKKIRYVSRFSRDKFFGKFRAGILGRIDDFKEDAVAEVKKFVRSVAAAYKENLEVNADMRKQEYDQILEAKKTAEEIQELIRLGKERLQNLEGLDRMLETVKSRVDENIR
jgi:GTPase SAR1 family protein